MQRFLLLVLVILIGSGSSSALAQQQLLLQNTFEKIRRQVMAQYRWSDGSYDFQMFTAAIAWSEDFNIPKEHQAELQKALFPRSIPPEPGSELDVLNKQLRECKSHEESFMLIAKMDVAHQKRIAEMFYQQLTPDQLQKFRELQLAKLSQNPFIPPNAFEGLNVSDEQMKEIKAAYKELEPQAVELLCQIENADGLLHKKASEELKKEGIEINGYTPPGKWIEYGRLIGKRREEIREKDEEIRKLNAENFPKLDDLIKEYQKKVFDILTDEQFDRLKDLMDNPPEYLKHGLELFKMGEKSKMGDRNNSVISSEDLRFLKSWKPGDGVPAWYEEQRREQKTNKKFPTKEKE